MQCEICGGSGANQTVIMDGAEMLVCLKCTGYGKPGKPSFNQNIGFRIKKQEPSVNFDDTPLIEDYGSKIKSARESRKMTVKEVAEKLFEKESVLLKVEQQKHPPEKKLIEKLERFFGIELRQKL